MLDGSTLSIDTLIPPLVVPKKRRVDTIVDSKILATYHTNTLIPSI